MKKEKNITAEELMDILEQDYKTHEKDLNKIFAAQSKTQVKATKTKKVKKD